MMNGVISWLDKDQQFYPDDKVLVNEQSTTGAHLLFEQIQLMDCYWDETDPIENPDQIPDRKPDFQFKKPKPVGKHMVQDIEKYKASQIDYALWEEGIMKDFDLPAKRKKEESKGYIDANADPQMTEPPAPIEAVKKTGNGHEEE